MNHVDHTIDRRAAARFEGFPVFIALYRDCFIVVACDIASVFRFQFIFAISTSDVIFLIPQKGANVARFWGFKFFVDDDQYYY